MKNPGEMTRLYRKGLSISNFRKFKRVMEQIYDRNAPSQQMQLKSHVCNRNDCQDRASTFYSGPAHFNQTNSQQPNSTLNMYSDIERTPMANHLRTVLNSRVFRGVHTENSSLPPSKRRARNHMTISEHPATKDEQMMSMPPIKAMGQTEQKPSIFIGRLQERRNTN